MDAETTLLDRLDHAKRWSELDLIVRDIDKATDYNENDDDDDECLAGDNFDDVSELEMNSSLTNKMVADNRISSKKDFKSFVTLLPRDDSYNLSKLNKSSSTSETSACDLQDFENLLKRDEGECIRRLVNKVHEQSADLRSTEMQFNHSKLQVQALLSSQQQLQAERDELQHALAVAEQDLLLMETKLQDVVTFESTSGGGSMSHTQLQKGLLIEDIRGHLLTAADSRIAELTESLRDLDQKLVGEEHAARNDKLKLASDNSSLKSELRRLSDQLAQRAVLSAAQERRWSESARIHDSHTAEKNGELIDLRARLQQLESTHERVDRERIDAVLQCRQLAEEQRRQESLHSDLNEKLSALDAEVADLSAQNLSLQTTVDRLRSSDLEGLERELAAEVEAIREEARSRELSLRRQLEEARDVLSEQAAEREQLLTAVGTLRADLEGKNSLLRQITQNGFVAPVDMQLDLTNQVVFHQFISNPMDETMLSEDQLRFDSSVNDHVSAGPSDNSHFAAMFDVSPASSSPFQDRGSKGTPLRTSNNDRYQQWQDDEIVDRSEESFGSDTGLSANLGYLIGEEEQLSSIAKAAAAAAAATTTSADGDDSSSRGAVFLSVNDSALEAESLRQRVLVLEGRERELAELARAQARQLAELSMAPHSSSSSNSSTATAMVAERDRTIQSLTSEVYALGEQLATYREELRHVEEQAAGSKQLGYYEASEASRARIKALEASVMALEERCKTAQFLNDGRTQAVSKLEETITLLRGELQQLRQSSSEGANGMRQELVEMEAAIEQLKALLREREAELAAEKADALLLREGRQGDESRLEAEVAELRAELSSLGKRHDVDVSNLQRLRDERDTARQSLVQAEAEYAEGLAVATELHSRERQRAEADALEERSRLVATHERLRDAVQQHWQQELESTVRSMTNNSNESCSAGDAVAASGSSYRSWEAESARLQQEHSEEVVLLQRFYEEELERLQLSVREASEAKASHSEEQASSYRRRVLGLTALNEEQQHRLEEQDRQLLQLQSLEEQVLLLKRQLPAAVSTESTSHDTNPSVTSAIHQLEYEHRLELERVREHLRRVHDEELRERLEVMQAANSARLVEYRKGVVGRYKEALLKQQEQFLREKRELEEEFRRECQQIFAEAQELVRQASGGAARRSGSTGRAIVSPAPEPGRRRGEKREQPQPSSEFTIYPEMLSPEVTNALFKKIAHRSLTEEETRSLFAAPASPPRTAASTFASTYDSSSGVRVSRDRDGKLQLSHSVFSLDYNTLLARFKGPAFEGKGASSLIGGGDDDDEDDSSVLSIDFHDAEIDPLPVSKRAPAASPARSGNAGTRTTNKLRRVTP